MSFDYSKSKSHGSSGDSFWTSYSDLFLGLSSIFLMLYVVASLRSGTDGIKAQSENNKLKTQVQDLKNQLQTYESVKNEYMKKAEKSEVDEYRELMDKLTLLQDEAKGEKEKLNLAAKENEKKEIALNKYQQMIRNIINSNKFSKVKIENRNEVIDEKDDVITEKEQDIKLKENKIANLNDEIREKQAQIRDRESRIQSVNEQLNQKMQELKSSFKKAKLTQKAYQKQMEKLKMEANSKVQQLAFLNAQAEAQLKNVKGELDNTNSQLQATKGALSKAAQELESKDKEVSNLQGQLGKAAAETKAKMDALAAQYDAQRAAERAAFEGELNKQKNMGAAERARLEGEYARRQAEKERQHKGALAALGNQLKSTEEQLGRANAELEARKSIANEIKKGFKAAGVKADIDGETGDVVLDFGQATFDNDSAFLKSEMKAVLQNAMPVYSKSLFDNPKVANKIGSVEIIGFASPTYKGKVVDPHSTKPEDRQALKYNMDLSYKRANSIFNYIVDGKEMDFEKRRELIPTLKVSGRSFLDLIKMTRGVASAEEYCRVNDCKKSQKVIIRFNLDQRKEGGK
ncbi:MAG: microtubule-binding protein [Pseudobdellovibrio sp.]